MLHGHESVSTPVCDENENLDLRTKNVAIFLLATLNRICAMVADIRPAAGAAERSQAFLGM